MVHRLEGQVIGCSHDIILIMESLLAFCTYLFILPFFFISLLSYCWLAYILSDSDFHFNHGCAWLRLGMLRLRLLLSCDDMDPAMKYYYKHSQMAEKISLLKLDIQVALHERYSASPFSVFKHSFFIQKPSFINR